MPVVEAAAAAAAAGAAAAAAPFLHKHSLWKVHHNTIILLN